jgi:hypothetical protein
VGEPTMDCGHVAVWPTVLTPTQIRTLCPITTVATYVWQLGLCEGAAASEDCAHWNTVAAPVHDMVWTLWEGLTADYFAGLLIPGVSCSEVALGAVRLIATEGNLFIWQGTVDVTLPLPGS